MTSTIGSMDRKTTYFAGPGIVRAQLQIFDYAAAGVAPPHAWSPALRAVMELMLDSAIPARLAIGPDLHLFYNDAYIQFLVERHPAALGQPYFSVWPEVRGAVEPLLHRVLQGQSVFLQELPLTLNRGGRSEAAWFSYTFTPVRDEDGSVIAIYGACIELTRQKELEAQLFDHNRRLTDMFRQAPGFIAILRGPQHVYEFVNDANQVLMGRREFVGRPVRDAVPELLAQGYVELLDKVYASGRPFVANAMRAEFDIDGQRVARYLSFVFQPILEPDGQVSGIFIEGSDITEQHLAQEETRRLNGALADKVRSLEEAGQRARFQVELSDEIRRAADAYAIQALGSAALGHFLGASRVCVGDYGDNDDMLVHSSYVGAGTTELIGTHALSAVAWANPVHFRPDGRAIPTGSPDDSPGDPNGAWTIAVPHYRDAHLESALFVQRRGRPWTDDELLLVDDAGARIWTAVDKARAEAALRQADRRKDEFLAMLAHELRNPLAPISAAAALITSVPLSQTQLKKTGDVIARQVRHMGALVDDLLDVSRVTKGLVRLENEALEMQTVVSAAVEQARPLLQERRHTVSVRVAPEPLRVRGDGKRLVQVLSNLLSNAAKYTPPGGEVGVALNATDETVRIDVADNGIGIAPGMEERIFELFAQAERTSDRAQGGLGLGLSLVRSIVDLHGGAVRCTSNGLGAGATFTVTLPRLHDAPGGREPAGTAPSGATAAGSALRVLVVDDNADAAEMLAMYVTALGHDVRVEHSSARALGSAREWRPDAGLFDIGLPGMDGYELARQMRSQPETARMMLAAVTGYGDRADVAAALDAGFDHHLVKPVDPQQLGALLAAFSRAR
jgi:signal transduction histidine kinase/ActR/RegA family two-component response regulator/PAS domain-containing protein